MASQQQTKVVTTGNREVNSRIAENKNPFRDAQSDNFVYIKGGPSNMSEHDSTKRKPHPTAQHVFDLVYVPDAGRVGLIHEFAATTRVTPDLLYSEIDAIRESLSIFNIKKLEYVEDMIDRAIDVVKFNGVFIGYVDNGATLYNEIMDARATQKISKYLPVKYDPQYCEVQLNTNAGRMMFPVIVLDPETGRTFFEPHETMGFDDKEHTQPIDVERLFSDGKLVWLYAEETDCLMITLNPLELVGFKYFMHPAMNQSRSNCQYLACESQAEGTRISMTTNQLRQNMSVLPEYMSWSLDKAQSQLMTCEKANYTCTYGSGKEIAVVNVLCALHMGGGDTNNDSSEMSSEVAKICGVSNRIFKMTYKTEQGQLFTNPNQQLQTQWQDKYSKLGEHGYADVGTIIKPNDIICVISDPSSGRMLEKTYTGTDIARVKDAILEYSGNVGSVTIAIEYTKTFKGGDKHYMPNACKSVVRIKNTNECLRTPDGRVVGVYYSSLSVLKRFSLVPHFCSLYQDLLDNDPDADCTEKIDLGSEISVDIVDIINEMKAKNMYLGTQYLINPITGLRTQSKAVLLNYSIYRNIHIAGEKEHVKGDQDSERRLDPMSQQSRSGKKADGGLRAGNLIRFAIVSSGSIEVLATQFLTNSDGRIYPICKSCGTNISVVYKTTGNVVETCNYCNTTAELANFDSSFSSNKVKTISLLGRQVNTKMVFNVEGLGDGKFVEYMGPGELK